MTEPELIARVLAGDRGAARELYEAHASRVFRLVFRLTGDESLSRELTQDTFVRAFGALRTFRGEAALATWIHRIALSVTTNALRSRRQRARRHAELAEAEELSHDARTVDPYLRDSLARALDALPEIHRTVVIMHDLEGYTHNEIAAILGVAEGTCKSRLSMARAQLRSALAEFAGDVET